jgi:site-specific recombinase XerD
LFFNSQGKKLSRQGITYILQKYTNNISADNISPHSLRHSKAIHMTEADINPIFIRDFLGHTDLKTTQIYSKTSVEMKRKALEQLNVHPIPDATKQKADWTEDQNLMAWLKSLQ